LYTIPRESFYLFSVPVINCSNCTTTLVREREREGFCDSNDDDDGRAKMEMIKSFVGISLEKI
jgi:hypothetical protein